MVLTGEGVEGPKLRTAWLIEGAGSFRPYLALLDLRGPLPWAPCLRACPASLLLSTLEPRGPDSMEAACGVAH